MVDHVQASGEGDHRRPRLGLLVGIRVGNKLQGYRHMGWVDFDAGIPQCRIGLGNILDTVLKVTEDRAHFRILSVSKIHFQPTCINGNCIEVYKRYRR